MIGQSSLRECVNRSGCRFPDVCGPGECLARHERLQRVRYNEPEYIKRIEDKLERVEQLLIRLADKYKEGE